MLLGTFSVVPRVAGGEVNLNTIILSRAHPIAQITPDKLIVLGQVAKKYNLYTKITGGYDYSIHIILSLILCMC
jgi:NAD(P)H-nitrite reductase large subunit